MKKTKKLFILVIVISMAVAALGGCARNQEGPQGQTPAPTGTANETGRASYRLVTVRWTDAWPIDFMKKDFMGSLEEEHNVDIKWDVYYNADWAEQKSLMLAGGDLPDAFFGSISLNDTDVAQNLSSFIPLDDLIADNMPNLTRIMEEDPTMRALVTSRDDGKIYSLPKRLPLRPKVADTMFINKKWLDNLNLKVPTTYLELQEVLQAFIDEDADGDGDDDNEYAYSNTAAASEEMRHLMIPFGTNVSRANNYMGLIDEKPVFMPITENFKNGTKWIRELYDEGLLDPERFTQDLSMVNAKAMAEGGSRVGIAFGWTADAAVGPNAPDFEVVEALEGPDGNRYVESDPTFLDTSNNELLVTTKAKNPERLMKWADALYTDEASLQTFYGSIPNQIKKNDDGTYTVLNPPNGGSLDTSAWSNSFRDFGPKHMSKEFAGKVKLPEGNGDGVKLAQDEVNAKHARPNFPRVVYTTDESLELADLSTDIYNYVETTYARWVVDGGIDEEWDDYIAKLKAMGLDRLIEIQINAFDAYQEILNK